MKYKKIRGHKRRWKDIEKWRLANLHLNHALIENYNSDHVDIVVHPWCDLSIVKSAIPHPKGKTKKLMLNALLDIHNSWKEQLDKSGQPYYLKVWLFEPRFEKSQVVCAVGDKISYYENLFSKPETGKMLTIRNYGNTNTLLSKFDWCVCIDEDYYDNSDLGKPEEYKTLKDFEEAQKWFKKLFQKPHTVISYKEPIGEITESYVFKRGHVWIGEVK